MRCVRAGDVKDADAVDFDPRSNQFGGIGGAGSGGVDVKKLAPVLERQTAGKVGIAGGPSEGDDQGSVRFDDVAHQALGKVGTG